MNAHRLARVLAVMLAVGFAKTVTADLPSDVLFVPVIVDASGLNGSRYTTEVTVLNASSAPIPVRFTYVAADSLGASGSGSVEDQILPYRELILSNAIDWLRDKGLAIPVGSPQAGTLRVEMPGTAIGVVLARTTTPTGAGRAGTSVLARRVSDLQLGVRWVFGVREDAAERSNLAISHAGTTGPITLRVSLYDESGATPPVALPDVTLDPGQWRQWNSVLAAAGISGGYARIERVSGTDPFTVYGVVNDNVTNDGALSEGVWDFRLGLSVAVESSTFDTDLIIANTGTAATDIQLTLETPNPGPRVTVSLKAGEQRTIPSVFEYLRSAGLSVGPRGPAYVWPIRARATGPVSVYVFARTFASGPSGGRYSEFNTVGGGASLLAGLTQDDRTRSNLAFVRDASRDYTGGGSGTTQVTSVSVYDAETGQGYPLTWAPSITNGTTWSQWNSVLTGLGIRHGWVRLTYSCFSEPFGPPCAVNPNTGAYASIVDGARPGEGTGDATLVP